MANLLFHPTELLNEVKALKELAERFWDRTSLYSLEELTGEIQGMLMRRGSHTLEIPEDRPLKTRVSRGEFEPLSKRKSTRPIYGSITGIWEVNAVERSIVDPSRPNKKAKSTMLIGFVGKASTVFEVRDVETKEVVACWKMELGDAGSPGCFFHTFASVDEGFPVPRHPNVFATPMSAIGFALSELFQHGWEQAVSGTSDAPNRWRSIQSRRLVALLNWQLTKVAHSTSSPWCSLKLAKPPPELFL
jgi:hypothetical protein